MNSNINSSTVVAALEGVWRELQARHTDIPDVFVVIGSGRESRRKLKLGHFASFVWHRSPDDGGLHELFIGGEGLRRGSVDVLNTLLHEATHGLAIVREIKDCARQGRYHNDKFRKLAEELGLECLSDPVYGFNRTKVPDATQIEYVEVIVALEAALTIYREDEFKFDLTGLNGEASGDAGMVPGVSTQPRTKAVVACSCDRRIRVAEATFGRGPIICGVCLGEFIRKIVTEE